MNLCCCPHENKINQLIQIREIKRKTETERLKKEEEEDLDWFAFICIVTNKMQEPAAKASAVIVMISDK